MIEARSDEIVSLRNPPDWYVKMTGGGPTLAGVPVNEEVAMSLTAVYSCVNLISRTYSVVPAHLNRRLKPRGKERDAKNPLYRLIHDRPNPEQTSFKWRQVSMAHKKLWGAAISEIERDANGYPIALWPIPPWRVQQKRTLADELFYEVTTGTKIYQLWPRDVLVLSELSTTPDKWMSPIALHRETIGSAIAVKQYGAKTFGSGINPAGILSGLAFSEEDTEESIRKKYTVPYQGMDGNSRLMLLEEGVSFTKIGLPPEDAQYLETRRFDISEIARIYNVPLYMLADHEKQTSWGTGIEEQKDGFMTFTMLPEFAEAEQELNLKLLYNNPDLFFEFLTIGLLRGTPKSRAETYKIFQEMGALSPDDIRESENLNPLPDGIGDVYLVPLNFQAVQFAKDRPVKTAKTEIAKGGKNAN